MVLRATTFLAIVLLLGWAVFRILIEDEVKRVVSVHALDKASHLVDMFEANPHTASSFENNRFDPNDYAALIHMAEAIHVTSIYFIDLSGENVSRMNSRDFVQTPAPDAPQHANHGHHTDMAASPLVGGLEGNDHVQTKAPKNDPGAQAHSHRHDDNSHDAEINKRLATTSLPGPDNIRPLVTGRRTDLIKVTTLSSDGGGGAISYADVILPVESMAGDRLGYIGFVLNVSHIYAVYAQGVAAFGILFMICGVVLFGVPTLLFWLQKRLAERSSKDAKYLSRHDALTGLFNRSAFVKQARDWLEQDRIGYVAYIDVDRFKLINDAYGHSAGDTFLRHVATLLQTTCGTDVLAARFGGDEFTVVLPKKSEHDAKQIFQCLMKEASRDIWINGMTVSASISIGIAEVRPDETLDQLLQRADIALYNSKLEGRRKATFYQEEMGARARRRRQLEERLREALRNKDFDIYYQPLVDAGTAKTIGYEALLRLNALDGTPISPAEFIPLAEEIGLIEEIGTWVLMRATEQISALDDQSKVSVNLSAEQFKSGKLVNLVSSALKQSNLPAHRLELEITESILLDHETGVELQIDALKEMGATIAMDDFGTGFSSLSTLWKYGFDRIKIDKSFVHALEETPEKSEQLIDAIILLGARMGMSITAEGVETADQRATLTAMGCNVLQGFLFGRPQPIPLQDTPSAHKTTS